MTKAEGWWWRGISTAGLLVLIAASMWAVGWVLAQVSDFTASLQ